MNQILSTHYLLCHQILSIIPSNLDCYTINFSLLYTIRCCLLYHQFGNWTIWHLVTYCLCMWHRLNFHLHHSNSTKKLSTYDVKQYTNPSPISVSSSVIFEQSPSTTDLSVSILDHLNLVPSYSCVLFSPFPSKLFPAVGTPRYASDPLAILFDIRTHFILRNVLMMMMMMIGVLWPFLCTC